MNERIVIADAINSDPILKAILTTRESAIVLPPGLFPAFMQLVLDYADQHRETPDACFRGVEIAVLQLGMRALRDELKANADLGERFGWAKEEGH